MFDSDIQAAADYAALFRLTLMTGPVDYEITSAFTPHDITWISDNTRIKQMSALIRAKFPVLWYTLRLASQLGTAG